MSAAIQLSALLIVLSALFGWINRVFFGFPHAIALLLMGLLSSIAALGIDFVVPDSTIAIDLYQTISQIDFYSTVMHGLLSFLLFAAALHVDIRVLREQKLPILLLATVGVLISTAVVGIGFWFLAGVLGIEIPLVWALVFGALISPTDPVAVLSVMKTVAVSKGLQAKIAGESLFNDGVGVIAFTVILAIAMVTTGIGGAGAGNGLATATGDVDTGAVFLLFSVEVFGAIALGIATGSIALWMISKVDDSPVETLISIALVFGTYVTATTFHLSGPIAAVIPGLIIGNWGSRSMSERTRSHLFPFWDLIDEVLNSVLFLLIGLEIIILTFDPSHVWLAVLSIPLVLTSRFLAVAIPVNLLRTFRQTFSPGSVRIMTWGGVRGGISVALALSLPEGPYKEIILVATYLVVVFSIVVQGLTIAPLIRRIARAEPELDTQAS